MEIFEMFGLGKIADALNGFMDSAESWNEPEFLTFACMMHDEWCHRHGGNPVENARICAEQVATVNSVLGAY